MRSGTNQGVRSAIGGRRSASAISAVYYDAARLRRRNSATLARLPQGDIEHHRLSPPREVSTKRREQLSESHWRIRSASTPPSRRTASCATVARSARTFPERCISPSSARRKIAPGPRAKAFSVERASEGRPLHSMRARASVKIASRMSRARVRSSSFAAGATRARPATLSQRPRSRGRASRSRG